MAAEVNDLAELIARGAAARSAGDLAGAERLFVEAVTRFPDAPEPRHYLAGVHRMQGRLEPAEAGYREALRLAPAAGATKRVLATVLLAQGRYAEGFELYEARHELPALTKPALPFPEWRGEPVAGKRLLIWPEQGFGDQIQFARFAPILAAMGAEVTLICAPALARLFAGSLTGVKVIAASGQITFDDPDYWVMVQSLAWRLGATPQSLPAEPYLKSVGHWRPLGPGPKIGIMTRGNPAHDNDANRSLDAADSARLRALPGRVVDLSPDSTGAADFAETAALLDQLDLVISVDTAVAHLAGAMGKPCWVLVPAVETDWRWMTSRSDTPWYPSMRLYRQAAGEDWGVVLDGLEPDVGGYFRSRQQGTSDPGQGKAS